MNRDSVTRGVDEEELNIPSESYHDNIEGNTQSDNEEEGNSTVRNGLPLENSCESSIVSAQSAPPPYEFYPPAKTFLDKLPNWVRRISRLDTHQAIYLPTASSQEEQTRSSRDRAVPRWSYYYYVIKDRFPNWTLPPFIAHHRILVLCVSFSALILFSFLLFCSVFFSPAPLPEPTVPDKIAEHSLRFLTLNIFMRPPLIRNNWSDYKDDRLAYIEKYILPHYDLIVFQEAFAFASRRKDRLIRTARQMGFNHHVESPRKYPWNLGIDGGLLLLSRFPIRESHRIEYPRGQHADWFSVKGAVHALIELNSHRKMHLYTTHTQASYDLNNIINPGDTATRLSQFNILRSFVQDTSNTDGHPILIAGDLNVDAATHKNKPITERSKESSPEYLEMVKTLHFDDLEDIVYKHYGYHPVTFGDYTTNDLGELVPAETVLTNWDQLMTVQSIDRIFWVSRNTSVLEPLSPQVEKFWVKENAEMKKEEKEQTGFTQISVTRGHIKRLNPSVRQTASSGSTYVAGKFILSRAYTAATTTTSHDDTEHKATKNEEVITGEAQIHEFKTETKRLLDIVANSLYSEKEIFVRELISNAADALEKLRQTQATQVDVDSGKPLEIRIELDRDSNQFIIQDFGIGMTLEELNANLGTIASSGSKKFMEKMEQSEKNSAMIGQFGVGFYSTFMVGNKIRVYTKSALPGSKGYCWETDGQGSYTVAEADNVSVGTKIVIDLREDSKHYSSQLEVDSIIKKYSNFVGFPIYLNGKEVNTIDALWTKDRNSVTPEQHTQFYRFIANAWDDPQYTLHFKTDSPLSISSVLYVPEKHMEFLGEQTEPGVSLYSRKVLIQPKSAGLLPKYLRFIKGVVDSEDIPLNVSRELLQDNILSRLRIVMTSRILKWLDSEAKKDPKRYDNFFLDYGQFIKEGACTDAMHKREIAKLLRFESSQTKDGNMISLEEYAKRAQKEQKRIYYLLTPRRRYAEESPYTEMFKKKGVELLYLYDTVDEFVVNHLKEFQGYDLISADSPEAASDPLLQQTRDGDAKALSDQDAKDLAQWIEKTLGDEVVKGVDVSRRLNTFPAIVLEHESPAMRKMMQMMQGSAKMEELPPTPTVLEINPDHPVMKGLFSMRQQNPDLAKLVTEQVYDNALCAAGVLDDPRSMITRLNKLLEITVNTSVVEQDKKVKA